MKILILGAGKMGSFFCDVLSMNHEVAIYDTDKERLRFTFNALRFTTMEEIKEFQPEMMINAVTVKYTIEAFNQVLPYLPSTCIISDIASVKTGLPEFYATSGHPFVSSHPMFGPICIAQQFEQRERHHHHRKRPFGKGVFPRPL